MDVELLTAVFSSLRAESGTGCSTIHVAKVFTTWADASPLTPDKKEEKKKIGNRNNLICNYRKWIFYIYTH